MKKLISITLILLMITSLFTGFSISADSAEVSLNSISENIKSGNFEYQVFQDETVIICKYTGTETTVEIPEHLDNLTVTAIGDKAFSGCMSLQSVKIPDSVKNIGSYAFESCENLTEINLPEGITTINPYTFYKCKNLPKIVIPQGVTILGENAFNYCHKLTKAPLPHGLEIIGNSAFKYCQKLSDIQIPETVTTIGEHAFNDCQSLTSITIPEGVTKIEAYTFFFCNHMEEINLPNTITEIGIYAFTCSAITEITIPESVTTIKAAAFKNCYRLTNITIPKNAINLGNDIFYDCRVLEKATILSKITTLQPYTFTLCSNLKKVQLPDTIKKIGVSAFSLCGNLESVTIPENVETIDKSAFNSCGNMKSIYFNSKPISFGENVFRECHELDDVYIYDIDAWCNNTYENDKSTPLRFADNLHLNNEPVKNIVIPDGVKTISAYVFSAVTLEKVIIPQSVTYIGDYAFNNCKNMTEITIPESVEFIGEKALGYYIDNAYVKIENFTIYGVKGTVAEEYAREHGFRFLENNHTHKVATIKAVAPTCKSTGLTEGKYCSDCMEVLISQEVLPTTNHETKTINKKPATYFEKGHTKKEVCKVCGAVIKKGKSISKLRLKTPKITAKGGKGKLAVKYKKVKDATGFQIKYESKNTITIMTYKSKTTITKIFKNLEKGTYKVRIRAFIKQGKNKAYSSWSRAKKVKVK